MSDTYTEFGALKYDPQEIARQGWGVAASGPTEDKLIVGFYRKSVLNAAKSRELGRRICEDKEYVVIQHPGENLTKVDRPVQESDKQRWPRQWAQYAAGAKQVPDGIPLSLLFPDKPSVTDMLLGYNIHTVEQLAGLSAHGISTIGMGGQDWVNKAAKYLEQAQKGVDFHKFEKAISEKDQQIATLTRQVNELGAQVARLANIPNAPQPPLQQPPINFDVQSSMIAALKDQEIIAPPSQAFTSDITSPDLSGEVRPRKQRSDKGVPRPRKQEN